MGVQFDRVLDAFGGPFAPINGFARPAPSTVVGPAPAGYAFSHSVNDAFAAVNRLLARGEEVYTLRTPLSIERAQLRCRNFLHPGKAVHRGGARRSSHGRKGYASSRFQTDCASESLKRIQTPRIALWDQYGGSITSGWARFILEQFEFPYQVVYPPTLDAGNLIAKFDVLILPDGVNFVRPNARAGAAAVNPDDVPAEYRDRVGRHDGGEDVPQILEFLNAGGTVLAIGSATDLAHAAAAADGECAGGQRGASRCHAIDFTFPARSSHCVSIHRSLWRRVFVRVTDFYYDNAPAFTLLPGPRRRGSGKSRGSWARRRFGAAGHGVKNT